MSQKYTWQPDQPLPKNADRKTIARIVSHLCFPVSDRTIETWPLKVCRPNRSAVIAVEDALAYAQSKLEKSVSYKQGEV